MIFKKIIDYFCGVLNARQASETKFYTKGFVKVSIYDKNNLTHSRIRNPPPFIWYPHPRHLKGTTSITYLHEYIYEKYIRAIRPKVLTRKSRLTVITHSSNEYALKTAFIIIATHHQARRCTKTKSNQNVLWSFTNIISHFKEHTIEVHIHPWSLCFALVEGRTRRSCSLAIRHRCGPTNNTPMRWPIFAQT